MRDWIGFLLAVGAYTTGLFYAGFVVWLWIDHLFV